MPKVYVIILNYKSWNDTIACLESVLCSDYINYAIILVDNFSNDDSIDNILKWANGCINVNLGDSTLQDIIKYRRAKPLKYKIHYEADLYIKDKDISYELTIIKARSNNGFSAGNNIGLKYAMAQGDSEYYWILNNDTLVQYNTLTELVNHHIKCNLTRRVGIVGGKILYYHEPYIIQCLGGASYNKYLGRVYQLGNGEDSRHSDNIDIKKLDYISGACMLVSDTFIKDIGLMSEDYFLYFEEIDWAIRGKLKGYSLDYTSKAIIFHKEGGTIGDNTKSSSSRSEIADYYFHRNKIVLTDKYFNILCGITIRITLLSKALYELFTGNNLKALLKIKLVFSGI